MATYWEIAAHSAYDMFSLYKYLIVHLVFSHLGFWIGNLFLIAPFPDLCLFVLFSMLSDPFWLKIYPIARVDASVCTVNVLFKSGYSNIVFAANSCFIFSKLS